MRYVCLLGFVVVVVGCKTQKPATTSPAWQSPPPLTGTLPTIVNLDWDKFPKDPGPNYTSSGRVWVVKTTGKQGAEGTEADPLARIGEATERAKAGDQIRVFPGTYKEPDGVVIGVSNIVLTAVADRAIASERAAAAANDRVVLTLPGKGSGIRLKSVDESGAGLSNIVINGIHITGCTECIDLGIDKTAQQNIVISNLTIEGGSQSSVDGIRVGLGYDGPEGTPTLEGLLIKNVTISNADLAISCAGQKYPCKSVRMENVKIKGRGMTGGWGADGIGIESGDNFLLYGVEVSDVGSDGIDLKVTRPVVWSCNVHHVKNNGIKLWHGGDIVNTIIHDLVAEATVVGEGNDGIGDRMRLLHVTIANQVENGYGIAIGYDSKPKMQVEIIDSIYYNTYGAAYVDGNCSLKIQNSLLYKTVSEELVVWGDKTLDFRAGRRGELDTLGGNNLWADPELDDNCHLRSNSPVFNKGLQLTSAYPLADAAGQPRVKGGAPDLGAFEER